MADNLSIDMRSSKAEQYRSLLPQLIALVEGETNPTANTANLMAALKQNFRWLWVGCYFVDGETLVLGPFQGPVACTRLFKGRGVCAECWESNAVVIVPDVDAFPGHVACSALSKSEIVLPIRSATSKVVGVLDVDSDTLNAFDSEDATFLQHVADLIGSAYA